MMEKDITDCQTPNTTYIFGQIHCCPEQGDMNISLLSYLMNPSAELWTGQMRQVYTVGIFWNDEVKIAQ